MLHLATGTSPVSLGKYPYKSALITPQVLRAADCGIRIANVGLIYIPPVISAYVGADITSGLLVSGMFETAAVTLFVDIGTNGEMAVNVGGRVLAASAPAGPAFEGMNISCGMRAETGAIESFEIREGRVCAEVIGNTEAAGICGSGLFDIVSELAAHGVIDQTGRFVSAERSPFPERMIRYGDQPAFRITDQVALTQKDIRQTQLAKGAIRAGTELLLREGNIRAEDVDRVLIAGSFGYHLRAKSLINIGLLPRQCARRIDFAGNTSCAGGKAFLLNSGYRDDMAFKVRQVEVLDLANMEEFERQFIRHLNF
jgi:uncharacterized 2Fe-2S/4Fe-4S cluster protein (DUF4445 family)